uniref:Protein Wnt n=1 Tax=Romanomermis culicivorax TaxID=13658 RepID=A0A915J4X8_ROMCU
MLYLDHKKICRAARTTGHKAHAELCSSHELVKEIMDGVKMGLQECGHQLRFHQWNCSQKYRSIGKMMTRSTKETAFVQAITSAGISFQVAQACRKGQISSCFCKHDKQRQASADAVQTFQWDDCSHTCSRDLGT